MAPPGITVWLLMMVTTFTPDHHITSRYIYVPFHSMAECEEAKANTRHDKLDISRQVYDDISSCVWFETEEDEPIARWPERK